MKVSDCVVFVPVNCLFRVGSGGGGCVSVERIKSGQ